MTMVQLISPAHAQPTARFDWFDYRGSDPTDTGSRPGPNDYRNPILQGFYPDPSVTRVGTDYYLVTSTFAYFPGIPVFHSRDLVNWTQIGNAIHRSEQLDFGNLGLSRGVFAPAITHRDGMFYILNTCVDCRGNFLITATDPAGPWSDPVWLPDLEGGIDPSLFFDDDGRAWIVNNGPPEGTPRYSGHRAIWIQEYDRAAMRTIGPRRVLVDGGVDPSTNPIWIEGPHILKVDGWYYLTCAEGGTAVGHSQVVLRSRAVTGPYAPYAGNPILTQRDLPEDRANPITSAGHAQLVQTPDGAWWATFLAVRPYRGDYYNTGRETFLLPVTWADGWPRILPRGAPIPTTHARPALPRQPTPAVPTSGPFVLRDQFDGNALAPYWLMVRNPRGDWLSVRHGMLGLTARPVPLGGMGNPSFVARRQQHRDAQVTTIVRFENAGPEDEAGLAAFQNDEHFYSIGIGRDGPRRVLRLRRRAGPGDPQAGVVIAAAPWSGPDRTPLRLRIVTDSHSYRFLYAGPSGDWRQLGAPQDGTILSTRTAGGFVGAVFGMYAVSGGAAR
ncbi:MAG TPA: glycoside hydrolase family 43 protein [Allosphingosinicella sp.]|nr:glycoside hydrolase family 43 protein [Allosphingosinicella sp.]